MSAAERKNWSRQPWLLLDQNDLAIEHKQLTEEGKDTASLESEFAAVKKLDLAIEENQRRAEALLDAAQELPMVSGYRHREPSDLQSIKDERGAAVELPPCSLDDDMLMNKALGGWAGRAAGCMLGKPVEGRRSWQIEKYLRSQNRWPLSSFFSSKASDEVAKECGFNLAWKALYEEGMSCMVEDDDTNYTTTGLAIVKQFGPDFTPDNVASFWLSNIPIFHVCTAERVAYKNLVASVAPPYSASFRNVYREWIGAQIRADFFGYVNPGNPETAAEYAWRDASISHVKNGIYGEMWVAAMISAAYLTEDIETVIRAGLSQVPSTSRLVNAIEHVIEIWKSRISYEDAIADLRTRWNENNSHDWCHTISNAEIVAISLLWGNKDYEKSICYSVMPGFDTDCNGATTGSVLGVMLGADRLPQKWVAPLNDTLYTGVAGYHKVSLSQMAQETVDLIHKCKVR